jgi:GNAT superfamily N-acetyltransferase
VVGGIVSRIGKGVPRLADVFTAVWTECGALARKHGARDLSVTAYSANDEAIAFYRRHGFRETSVTLART